MEEISKSSVDFFWGKQIKKKVTSQSKISQNMKPQTKNQAWTGISIKNPTLRSL